MFKFNYKKPSRYINGQENSAKIDPAWFDDPIACKTEWVTMQKGNGANFCTRKLDKTNLDTIKFMPTAGVMVFSVLFILFPAGILCFLWYKGAAILPAIIILCLMLLAGLYSLYSYTSPIVFDKTEGIFKKGRKQPDKYVNRKFTALGNIHALQLLSKYNWETDPNQGVREYYSYELNLVLQDGKRINVVSHGNLERIRTDAQAISTYINKPVWDAI